MSLRLLGALLFLSGCTYAGFASAERLGKKHRFLLAMARACRRMGEEMAVRMIPLSDLFSLFCGRGEAGVFFRSLCAGHGQAEEAGAEALWRQTAASLAPVYRLSPEDLSALNLAGEGLGRLPLSRQTDRLCAAGDALSRQAELAGEAERKYASLLRFSGFGTGAAVCLLLL